MIEQETDAAPIDVAYYGKVNANIHEAHIKVDGDTGQIDPYNDYCPRSVDDASRPFCFYLEPHQAVLLGLRLIEVADRLIEVSERPVVNQPAAAPPAQRGARTLTKETRQRQSTKPASWH